MDRRSVSRSPDPGECSRKGRIPHRGAALPGKIDVETLGGEMLEIDEFDENDVVDEEVQVPILFEVKVTATGEVRDKDGNLLNVVPMESTAVMTAQELDEFVANMKEDND
jgi:hypothetical protein